jgi:MFS family permease
MAIFLDGYDLFIIAVAFPLIDQQMAIPSFLVGAIAASVVAGAAVGALVGGSLADRFGRRRLFNWAMAAFIVVTMLTAIAWDPYSLLIGRSVMGIAIGAVYPLSAATLSEFMPASNKRRTLFVSAFSFQALGIFIGAGLAWRSYWPTPMRAPGGSCS